MRLAVALRLRGLIEPFPLRPLLGVVVVSVLLQLGIHHIPVAQDIFEIGALSATDCALTLLVALVPVTVIELSKLARRSTVFRKA